MDITGAGGDLTAAAAAFGFYGLCGDLGIKTSDKPGSFRLAFLDVLYSAGDREIEVDLNIRKI